MYYYSVAPRVRTIRGKDQFTYHSDQPIEIGALVRIPWRTQQLIGVVMDLADARPSTKPIQLVQAQLPQQYLAFLRWFSSYYHISLPSALLACLPEFKTKHSPFNPIPSAKGSSVVVARQRLSTIQAVIDTVLPSTQLTTVIYRSFNEVAVILRAVVAAEPGSVILICPTISDVRVWAQRLSMLKPLVIPASNRNALEACWSALFSGSKQLAIGTKRLALLPLTQASRVIVLDPEHEAHKQWDQNPRYHVQRVVDWMTTVQLHPAIYFSQSPRVDQLLGQTINTQLVDAAPPAPVLIVSPEPGQLLPSSCVEAISESDVVVVLHQRKGVFKFLVCMACQTVLLDPLTEQCTNCASHQLRKGGFGTASLKRWLSQQFPNRPLLEITSEQSTMPIPYKHRPIIIGTSAVFLRVDWSQVHLSIATSVDGQLAHPNFRSHEQTLQQLIWLRNRVPTLRIVSYTPDHPVLMALNQSFPQAWYQQTLHDRQRYQLPPFGEYAKRVERGGKSTQVYHHVAEWMHDPTVMIDREC